MSDDTKPENGDGAARAWVMLLISDMSWLVGAAEGSGTQIPTRITDDLQEALAWISGAP